MKAEVDTELANLNIVTPRDDVYVWRMYRAFPQLGRSKEMRPERKRPKRKKAKEVSV
jgi:hypothetical protein